MWSLKPARVSARSDRGVILVWVALMMVLLLGMGALAIDVGALYREKRELQNGADAAALAVAQDCAVGSCTGAYGNYLGTAQFFANENASDEAADIASPTPCGLHPDLVMCPNPPDDTGEASGWVMVTTSTRSESGSGEVKFVLAHLLPSGSIGGTVDATAIAAWGPIGQATTIPLTVRLCEYEAAVESIESPQLPSPEITIIFKLPAGQPQSTNPDCPVSPANATGPGNFGWLNPDSSDGDCTVDSDLDEPEPGKTGEPPPNVPGYPHACDPSAWLGEVVIIPIFEATNDRGGNNLDYHIEGYVGFELTGFNFPGDSHPNKDVCGSPSVTCITGIFREAPPVDTDDEFGEFGALGVKMIG